MRQFLLLPKHQTAKGYGIININDRQRIPQLQKQSMRTYILSQISKVKKGGSFSVPYLCRSGWHGDSNGTNYFRKRRYYEIRL